MELALKYLDSGTMLAITKHWLEDRSFVGVPEVAGLHGHVREVHDNLLAATPAKSETTNPKLAAHIVLQRALDIRHDHSLRAGFFLFRAAEELALSRDPPDEAEAEKYAAARAELYPNGLDGTSAAYLAEEGNAQKTAKTLKDDESLGKTVASVGLTKKDTGTAIVAHYVSLGRAVGDSEREKIVIASEDPAIPATLRKSRNDWIHLVTSIVALLQRSKSPDARAFLDQVVIPATKAAKAARAAAQATKNAPADPGAGSTEKKA